MTKRHWTYWRSAIRDNPCVWGTRIDDDGQGYTKRWLYSPFPGEEPETHYAHTTQTREFDAWRISHAEALERVDAQLKQVQWYRCWGCGTAWVYNAVMLCAQCWAKQQEQDATA